MLGHGRLWGIRFQRICKHDGTGGSAIGRTRRVRLGNSGSDFAIAGSVWVFWPWHTPYRAYGRICTIDCVIIPLNRLRKSAPRKFLTTFRFLPEHGGMNW